MLAIFIYLFDSSITIQKSRTVNLNSQESNLMWALMVGDKSRLVLSLLSPSVDKLVVTEVAEFGHGQRSSVTARLSIVTRGKCCCCTNTFYYRGISMSLGNSLTF